MSDVTNPVAPLTAEEEAELRRLFDRAGPDPYGVRRLLATLDAARAASTPAGLREAAQAVVDGHRHFGPTDDPVCRLRAALDVPGASDPREARGTICKCGLAKSYHGPPTNLADDEYEPRYAVQQGEPSLDVERLHNAWLAEFGTGREHSFQRIAARLRSQPSEERQP